MLSLEEFLVKMEIEKLTEILRNAEATPSDTCWGKLAEQLSAMPDMPAESAPSAQIPAAAARHTLSLWAKIGLAAAAGGAATGLAVLLTRPAPAPPIQPAEPVTLLTDSTLHDTLADTTSLPVIAHEQRPTTPHALPADQQKHTAAPIATPAVADFATSATTACNNEQNAPATSPAPKTTTENTRNEATANPDLAQPTVPTTSTVSTPVLQQPIAQPANEDTHTQEETPLEIPNVITPNGDDYNDVFIIQGLENYASHLLIITNQEGRQLLLTRHYQNDWGHEVNAGTYFFQLSYSDGRTTRFRNGVITVVR